MGRESILELTSEDVFNKTDNGLNVFKKEIEDFSLIHNVKNPFIIDKNPSCKIKKSSNGIWLLNVYNDTGGFYNCITFIQKKYNLNYQDAIEHIYYDKDIESSITKEEKDIIPIFYDFTKQNYTEKHKEYYCIQGLTEEFLVNEMDIYAVKYININHNVLRINKNQFVFAYAYKNILGEHMLGSLKLLYLGDNVDKKNKWRNNLLPYSFFYTYKIKPNTTVFVCKSNKDAAITQFLGITSIASMSENVINIITGLKTLIKLFPTVNFVLNLGSDIQGAETSIIISKELKLKWFNTPKTVLSNDVNDNFSYVQSYGIESFKKLLKKKKYL